MENYIIFWNASGKLVYALESSKIHVGLNVVCRKQSVEEAEQYIKSHSDHFEKVKNGRRSILPG